MGIKEIEQFCIVKVVGRKSLHSGKFMLEVAAEVFEEAIAPLGFGALFDDVAADGPVEADQLCVDADGGLDLGGTEAVGDIADPRGVGGVEKRNRTGGVAAHFTRMM